METGRRKRRVNRERISKAGKKGIKIKREIKIKCSERRTVGKEVNVKQEKKKGLF